MTKILTAKKSLFIGLIKGDCGDLGLYSKVAIFSWLDGIIGNRVAVTGNFNLLKFIILELVSECLMI